MFKSTDSNFKVSTICNSKVNFNNINMKSGDNEHCSNSKV